ncbi:RhtB family permease [Oleiphilus messinensis]|uniref:RhtB family permease n=1 Tax=Oleiphilus messinensis TaxID=141451 RepID=A0A1Y0IDM3_9GAMM|nr:LysE family translocator [Oleiphilus messinensis]ARU58541.1 RhtB family permease [Oleiphilus messinensis]
MTFESAVTFFIAIFIFGITPGPGVLAILAKGMANGWRSCLSMIIGMASSDVVYLILACLGLAAIAQNWGEVFTVIRWVGAAYLVYLGYKLWTTPVEVGTGTESETTPKKFWPGFVQGFLISASNPKVILFYIAFLPTFLDVTALSAQDMVLASVLTMAGLLLGLVLIAYFAGSIRRYFTSAAGVKRLNKTAGSVMIGAGSVLVMKG